MATEKRSVGQALLDVPFPEMVEKLALAFAEAELALDLNGIKTAQALAGTTLPENTVVVAIKETVDADGNVTATEVLYNDKEMPLLVYGIDPTFHTFSETVIGVKMAITMAVERATKFDFGQTFSYRNKAKFNAAFQTGGPLKPLAGSAKASAENTTTVAYRAAMNASDTGKLNRKEEGASLLRTVLRPVPPPQRVIPKIAVQQPAPNP